MDAGAAADPATSLAISPPPYPRLAPSDICAFGPAQPARATRRAMAGANSQQSLPRIRVEGLTAPRGGCVKTGAIASSPLATAPPGRSGPALLRQLLDKTK